MTLTNLVPQFPTIASLTGAILGLLAAALAIMVIAKRVRLGIEDGDGGIPAMAQAVRAHANFAEHAPLALLLLVLLEASGVASTLVVGGVAVLLVAGRAMSAIGLSRSLGPSFPRQAGASLTILSSIIAAAALLWGLRAAFT